MQLEALNLSDCAEFTEPQVAKKSVASGEGFKSIMINMLPGQEVPIHSHAGFQVLLLPQDGSGILFDNDSQVNLSTGSLYIDRLGSTFGLRNPTEKPFRVLVMLIAKGGT
jgi:mannose-6-phosphate isomerase-like protein (cupin superfamily)